MIEFKDLVGTHILQGVEQIHNYKFETVWGGIEDTNATIIRISNKNYIFIDDPSDGWRSYCRDILETDVIPKYSIPDAKVRIEISDKPEFVGINIIDEITNLTVLEIGTSYSDDYYPCCVMSYTPENLSFNNP